MTNFHFYGISIFYGIKDGYEVWEGIKIIHSVIVYREETRVKINDPNFWDRMAVWIVVFWVVRGNFYRELRSRESSGPAYLHDEFEMMVGFLGGCLTASEVGGLTLLRERMVVDNVVVLRWQLTWKSKSRGLNLWLRFIRFIRRKWGREPESQGNDRINMASSAARGVCS